MMTNQLASILDVIWPALGLLAFVILWAWFLTKDDGKGRGHLPPAE
jgi:hypothetical protein